MMRLLKSFLRKTPREHPAKKLAPSAKLRSPSSNGDFRAVSLIPGIACCKAAKDMAGKSYLLRVAPRLPLADCTTQANCSCRFRKTADRRDSDRRLLGAIETNRWFAGTENRKRGGRRSTER
jgi:hypothetical protein